tara:strand:- start:3163 stop:3705 length:543 start_codon:yes stop_codon:yes gene_type:complete
MPLQSQRTNVPGWKSVNQGGYQRSDLKPKNQWSKGINGNFKNRSGGAGGASSPQSNNSNIYSNQQTREAVNQARANTSQSANLPDLLGQLGRGGMSSYSPYMMSQAMNPIAQARVKGQLAGVQIPFGDDKANAGNQLGWETLANSGKLGRVSADQRLDHLNRGYETQNLGNLAQLLSQFS